MTSTDVNIGGFVKMLHAAKEAGVKRFVYAASSSTYGDSKALPKVEHKIGNALSPYAITKYVDELFAKNFSDIYEIETIGLRYFNVFGRRQDPNGAYAAVIPLFVKQLIKHESPRINGDGSYSRDFTYIENVIQANQLAAITPTSDIWERLSLYEARLSKEPATKESMARLPEASDSETTGPHASNTKHDSHTERSRSVSQIFNVAYGERTSLNQLAQFLKDNLAKYDLAIANVTFYAKPILKF